VALMALAPTRAHANTISGNVCASTQTDSRVHEYWETFPAQAQSRHEKRSAHKNPGGQMSPSGYAMLQSLGRRQMLVHA
jgi:hypothetical protein